jgi:hypothetical protein
MNRILSVVQDFGALDITEKETCNDLIRKMPIHKGSILALKGIVFLTVALSAVVGIGIYPHCYL